MPCHPRTKNVSFNRIIKIRSVPSLDDFSKEEQTASWFSSYEFDEIRSRERRLKANEQSLEDALRNEIGLESAIERRIRRARVDLGKYSVLLEQQRQWQEKKEERQAQQQQQHDDDDDTTSNPVCPESLARVTSVTSEESAMIALQKALSVAQQVHADCGADNQEEEETDRHCLPPRRPLQSRASTSRGMYSTTSDPFSKSSSSNQKWSVTSLDTGLSLPSRQGSLVVGTTTSAATTTTQRPKYDLKKLTGLVSV